MIPWLWETVTHSGHQFSTLGGKIGSCEGWKSEKLYSVLCNDLHTQKKDSKNECIYVCV